MQIQQQISEAEVQVWKLLNDDSKPEGTKIKIMSNAMYYVICEKTSKTGFKLTMIKGWGKRKQVSTHSTNYHFRSSISYLSERLTQ